MHYEMRKVNGRAVIVLAGVCALVVTVAAHAGAAESSAAASTFAQKCAGCHAADGSGATVVGKSAHIPDLRSPQVQNQADPDVEKVIANGKGTMPAFGTSLSNDEIKGLVVYVRALAKKQ
jgi:mono/diheme cytochrome c family protein